MGSRFKEETKRDLIKSQNLVILLLEETKLEALKMINICKLQWKRCKGIMVSSRGASRAIFVYFLIEIG